MSTDYKTGAALKLTISRTINRASARKTLLRLFNTDKAISKPVAKRMANFPDIAKRRGGRIWTKRPNKTHPSLNRGDSATVKATPQLLRDLHSVETFVTVAAV